MNLDKVLPLAIGGWELRAYNSKNIHYRATISQHIFECILEIFPLSNEQSIINKLSVYPPGKRTSEQDITIDSCLLTRDNLILMLNKAQGIILISEL